MDAQNQRRSKQQASQNITLQSRKRQREFEDVSADESSSSLLPVSIYGSAPSYSDLAIPDLVQQRDMIRNALLNTVSDMYFGTSDPFPEILRCLDDRIDPHTRRYVSGLITAIKSEIQDGAGTKKANKEKVIVTPLDMLACPFRKPHVIDSWTPYEIALFELAICEVRGFHVKKIHAFFDGRKTIEELNAFFDQVYCKSDNYRKIARILSNQFGISSSPNDDTQSFEEMLSDSR
jgi:hypothetical protein